LEEKRELKLEKTLRDDFVLKHQDWLSAIIEDLKDDLEQNNLCIIGIHKGGILAAKWLKNQLQEKGYGKIGYGELDITLYRDDFSESFPQPVVAGTHLLDPIANKAVILVDDVLYTGRTIRAALDELMDYGRPKLIRLAVQVDRGHRELPIHPDFAAYKLKTLRDENIKVLMKDSESIEGEVQVWK